MVEYPMPPAPECNCPAGTFYEELDNTFRCSVAPEPPETPVEPDPSQPSPQPSKAPSGNNMDTIIVAGAAAAVAAILIVSLIGKKG
jgi:rubredoxin